MRMRERGAGLWIKALTGLFTCPCEGKVVFYTHFTDEKTGGWGGAVSLATSLTYQSLSLSVSLIFSFSLSLPLLQPHCLLPGSCYRPHMLPLCPSAFALPSTRHAIPRFRQGSLPCFIRNLCSDVTSSEAPSLTSLFERALPFPDLLAPHADFSSQCLSLPDIVL